MGGGNRRAGTLFHWRKKHFTGSGTLMDAQPEDNEASVVVKDSCVITVPHQGSCICEQCHLAQRIPQKIPLYAPYSKRDLKKGDTFLWCSCGLSKSDPYCDKTCEEEQVDQKRFKPLTCTLLKEQKLYSICGCKYTKSPPFCDGSHGTMPARPEHSPCRCSVTNDW